MIIHVYLYGRFGPERSFGFVECNRDAIPLRCITGRGWDVVKAPVVPQGFITNPTGAATYRELRKARRKR